MPVAQIGDWLTRIQADTSDAAAIDKVVQNKPETLTDGCWTQGHHVCVRVIRTPNPLGRVNDPACTRS